MPPSDTAQGTPEVPYKLRWCCFSKLYGTLQKTYISGDLQSSCFLNLTIFLTCHWCSRNLCHKFTESFFNLALRQVLFFSMAVYWHPWLSLLEQTHPEMIKTCQTSRQYLASMSLASLKYIFFICHSTQWNNKILIYSSHELITSW